MARKTQSRSWLQVFQKPKSDLKNDQDSNSSVLLDDDPNSERIPSEVHPSVESEHRSSGEKESALSKSLVVAKKTLSTATTLTRSTTQKVSSATKTTAERMRPFVKAWKWQLIWLSALGVFGGTAGVAFLWLSHVPPAVNCREISTWSTDSDRLFCAQEAARSGKAEAILDGIKLVKGWSSEHPLYGQSQALLQDWSNALLILARDRVAQRDVNGAVALANQVPKNSSVYKEAQAAIDRWQAEQRRAQGIYNKLQAALKKQNWNLSIDLMAELSLVDDPGWQDRLGEIRERINAEKSSWKNLIDARNFAKSNPPTQLGKAIALTDPIDRRTYVWTLQARQEVIRWRNTVFSLAIAHLDKDDIPGASSLMNSLPSSLELTTANRDFIRLVRGREAIALKEYRTPTIDLIAPLMLATHMVKQIDEQSPFFGRAKELLPRLEQKTQDLTKLGIANNLASLQQIPALRMAVVQAQSIQPKRPGRAYAQTLLAQWRKELQWMEDRPLLTRARQVAKSGKLGPLRSAVAMANLIKPKRALRTEAQADVSTWTYQIQVIEDRPIIAQARAIANSGRLEPAIDVVSKIRPGRALYNEAQGLIGEWVYQIQIIEDSPIIARARDLAAGGYLSRAIDVASQIAPGRALYGEAQGLIADWAAERDEIWRQREQASSEPEAPAPEPAPPREPQQRADNGPDSPQASPEPTPP
jgi:hypothetical protein